MLGTPFAVVSTKLEVNRVPGILGSCGCSQGSLHFPSTSVLYAPPDFFLADSHQKLLLGSPVVPFTLFFGSGFPYKIPNPKKGALIIIWLLGYQG